MDQATDSLTTEAVALRVRRNTGSAALGAICLLYFGFLGGFSAPPVTDLFTFGDALFNYTLRIGGVLMALVAIGSLSGKPIILLLDAVSSVAIGLGLVLAALAMIVGGHFTLGFNFILYVIFGGMFMAAGLRNGRDFAWLTSRSSAWPTMHDHFPQPPTSPAAAPEQRTGDPSLASELLQRRSQPPVSDVSSATLPETAGASPSREPVADDRTALSDVDPAYPPIDEPLPSPSPHPEREENRNAPAGDDGFLASFADDETPRMP